MRTSASGLALMAMLALVWLPPEHAHLDDEDHHADVVHRHYEPHHEAAHGTHVDDDEHELIQWLDSPFTARATARHVSPENPALHARLSIRSVPQTSVWTPHAPSVSVHDPPGAPSVGLRAPPDVSCPV